jgi:hypothetical protein
MTHRDRDSNKGWEKVPFTDLMTLATASWNLPRVVDFEALAIAKELKETSLVPGKVIEVLASDNQFYPATITSMTKNFFTVTYNGTNGNEREVVRRAQYTTSWRFVAVSREQRWLAEAARVHFLANPSV